MEKELQDLAWRSLPEEVKKEIVGHYSSAYQIYMNSKEHVNQIYYTANVNLLENLFGEHNLTSDEDGEEMLTVSAKRVRQNYSEKLNEKGRHTATKHDKDMATGWCNALRFLFGSKCLPDETQSKQKNCDNPLADKEGCRWRNNDGKCSLGNGCYFEPSKSEEPKFKVGDRVRSKNVYKIAEIDEECAKVRLEGFPYVEDIDNIEPYTESYASHKQPYSENYPCNTSHGNRNLSQDTANCDISRLQIAAMAMQGLISDWVNAPQYTTTTKETVRERLARESLCFADALIAEAKKGEGK